MFGVNLREVECEPCSAWTQKKFGVNGVRCESGRCSVWTVFGVNPEVQCELCSVWTMFHVNPDVQCELCLVWTVLCFPICSLSGRRGRDTWQRPRGGWLRGTQRRTEEESWAAERWWKEVLPWRLGIVLACLCQDGAICLLFWNVFFVLDVIFVSCETDLVYLCVLLYIDSRRVIYLVHIGFKIFKPEK